VRSQRRNMKTATRGEITALWAVGKHPQDQISLWNMINYNDNQ
jgi:hypothetical protein